jgi:3-oxoacyl-[acyl-carrier-protein] synthase-3
MTAGRSSRPEPNARRTITNNGVLHGVRIAGVGHYAPERVLSNAELERTLDTSDEWIVTRTGISERRIASDGVPTSTLAEKAARNALADAGLEITDVDCVIIGTTTPDYIFPATAVVVAAQLGASGMPAFDIEIACSGFVYILAAGAGMVRSGIFRRILVIGAEKLSSFLDYEDRGTAVIFGDGAGAAVIERCAPADNGLLGVSLGSDGTVPDMLYVPAGGTREPLTPDGIAAKRNKVHMRGREIFRSAVERMCESSRTALDQAGLTTADVSLMVPHQANKRIIDLVAKTLGVAEERVFINIDRYGNTSAASIPIALSEVRERGLLKAGDVVLFSAFGGGLSWGSIVWRWSV